MLPQVLLFLFVGLQVLVLLVKSSAVSLPNISSRPTNASQILDPRLASFSIEFSYLPSFGGNLSEPNTLTKELLQHLVERTGVGPDLRPGGITVDSTIYDPDGPALVLDESSSGGVYRTTYGPAYYESLAVFPDTSRFVIDLNLGNASIEIAENELQAAIQHVGWDRVYSIELGNEPDQYAGSIRPANWTSQDYVDQFLNFSSALTKELSLPPHVFQAGAFAINPTPSAPMTTISTIEEGIDDTGVVKLFDQHTYQYSTCDPTRNAIATLPNLINHQNITAYLDLWKPQIAAAKGQGKEFVVGEYNSVSCSGKENVTDTFGQALWLADTILYGSFLNISRMYLHQGATLVLQSSIQANTPGFSWYDLWYPIPTDRYGSPRASASYVAYLLVTEAVGSSRESQISLLDVPDHPQLAIYAVWDPAERQDGIARLIALNLAVRNESTPAEVSEGLATTIDLTPYLHGGVQSTSTESSKAYVKRMTSPGLDSKDVSNILWAGQSYANGTAVGQETKEPLKDGQVTVQGSEGLIVFF